MSTQTTFKVEHITLQPQDGLAIRETVPMDALPAFFGRAFAELGAYISQHGAGFAGPPFAQYHSVTPAAVDVEAVFPLASPIEGSGPMQPVSLSGGPAVQVLHTGPYDSLMPVYDAITAWLAENAKSPSEPIREVYLTDPGSVPDPAQWQTLVIQPYE
ncbi:MAG: AraC family transcriptional regulator [Anaerolinea sp.]|nr:AraC family transcriptional regulator [Anaerolinea sp.]